jgi:hypothetical protein
MKESSAVLNATIQALGIMGTVVYNIEWAIYPSIFLLGILIFAQTLAAGYYFTTKELPNTTELNKYAASKIFLIMVGIMYMATSYQIYLLGYELFAGFAFAHSAIMLTSSIMKKEQTE